MTFMLWLSSLSNGASLLSEMPMPSSDPFADLAQSTKITFCTPSIGLDIDDIESSLVAEVCGGCSSPLGLCDWELCVEIDPIPLGETCILSSVCGSELLVSVDVFEIIGCGGFVCALASH
jgi:hypothetical protein